MLLGRYVKIMTSLPKKRGKLSNEEMAFIRENSRKMPKERIAHELNRTIEPIERYIAEQGLSTNTEENDRTMIKKRLLNKYFWKSIEDQLEPEEIGYFVNGWIDMMEQFNNDVTATDEQDMKQYLLFEISKNRCGKLKRKQAEDIEKWQKMFEEEELKGANKDPNLSSLYAQMKGNAQNMIIQINGEMDKYVKSCADLMKGLKATRADRIKQVESGQTTFMSVLKFLEDKKNRELRGRIDELQKLAADKKTKEDLYSLHQYGDGSLDPIILNHESSQLLKDMERQEEQEKRTFPNQSEEGN